MSAEYRPSESIAITAEMQNSYLDYAMSVIVSRALPDVRDGLKPVHRRILYAQNRMGNLWNRKYIKSAKVVGETMGNFHPHGDSAIYDALARLTQDFSMRLPLEDGQGNFGSMDGDSPAAMRYTEIRMSKAADYLLSDIDQETVDFQPNYDGSEQEPVVLPARFPNILVNGGSGIAVGMATNIPPHNLGEVVDATLALVDAPEMTLEQLCDMVPGPDFPTGANLVGAVGARQALMTGRGSVIMRAKTTTEETKDGGTAIIVQEVPYQVNKATLCERIGELARDKIITDIKELRDESDRFGVRVVVELKKNAHVDVVLSQLFKMTALQTSFSYNMMALDKGRPRQFNLKEILERFLAHREEVITRRTHFQLRKARDRAHVLAGLATAVANVDEVIKLIRNAASSAEAKDQLIARTWPAAEVRPLLEILGDGLTASGEYQFSDVQAQAILDLRLHRLTGMEREKIQQEADEIKTTIEGLINILANRPVLLDVLKDELREVKELFATPRKSIFIEGTAEVTLEDLITPEDMVVTISTDGYVKRQPVSSYRAQRRGGKGRAVAKMKGDEEQVASVFIANTHDSLLFFSTTGQVYKIKTYELPQVMGAGARGKAFVNLLPLEKDENVYWTVPTPREKEEWDQYVLLFATKQGVIRKTPLTAFNNVYANGIKGMNLNEGDELVSVVLAKADEGDVLLSSAKGQAVRFAQKDLRTIGSRTAYGVKGMTLRDKDTLVSLAAIKADSADYVLTVTENGFGKCTPIEDYPTKSRGTLGVISIKTTDRNGKAVAVMPVEPGDQILLTTSDGQMIRINASDISVVGRNTQGVTLFKTDGKSKVTQVSRIPADMLVGDDEEGDDVDLEAGDIAAEIVAETVAENSENSGTELDA